MYFFVEVEMPRKDFQKYFYTEYIVTRHPVLCVAQRLLSVIQFHDFFVVDAELASLCNKIEVVCCACLNQLSASSISKEM